LKPETQNFIIKLLIGIAVLLVIGGFIFTKQYKFAVLLICVGVAGVLISQFLSYADERSRESVHMENIMASLLQQQQDFYTKKIDYLLDRIQTGDPIVSHNLNVPALQKQPGKQVINLPVVDGVEVMEAKP
jgi:hypothetical protein